MSIAPLTPSYTTLISATELASLSEVFIIDCSFDLADVSAGLRAYESAHIKGAMYMHLEQDLSGPKIRQNTSSPPINGRHPLPERSVLANKLASLGLRERQQVVVYDRSSAMYAARAWWLLRWLGHEAVAALDGGLQAWQAQGGAVDSATPSYSLGNFKASAALQSYISKTDVAANLSSRQRLVIDARAPERFRGDVEPIDPIGGHIPNAINRPFKDNLQNNGSFKSKEQLYAEFAAHMGKYRATEVVAQCGSGVTACHNILAMEYAGLLGAILYPGSWSEWCADTSLPVVKTKPFEA